MGLVYNNRRSVVTHEDPHMRILPGVVRVETERRGLAFTFLYGLQIEAADRE